LKARDFERAAAEFAMHRARVPGDQIVALRGRGCEQLQVFAPEPGVIERRAHRRRAHRGAGVQDLPVRRQRVVAGLDPVPAQRSLADARLAAVKRGR